MIKNTSIAKYLPAKNIRLIGFFVVFVAWLVFVLPWVSNFAVVQLQQNQLYSSAHTIGKIAQYVSWHDQDIVLKNVADTSLLMRKYDQAAVEYKTASKVVPDDRKCPVYFNWALTITEHALSIESQNPVDALALYLDALRTVTVEECLNNKDTEVSEKFKELKKFIEDKIKDLQEQLSENKNDKSGKGDDDNKDQKQGNEGDSQQGKSGGLGNSSEEITQQQKYNMDKMEQKRNNGVGGINYDDERIVY